MHVVVTDDESYNKKIKQRKKNRNFFFLHGGIFDSEDDFLKNVSF